MSSFIKNKAEIRKQFPITEKYVYLDHAAVAPVTLNAAQAVIDFYKEATGEAFFAYEKWMEEVEVVRSRFASLIGSAADEVAFVRNTSHGISLVASGLDWNKGDSVIVYKKEFPSNIYPWLDLESRGVEIRYIEPNGTEITVEDVKRLADDSTRLITISSVQFTSGFRADLEPIGKFCSERGILFFVDAIQSLGIVPMDVKKYCIDFLAADGHKWMLSPEGTGIFYCNSDSVKKIHPSLIGWKTIVNEFEYENIDFTIKPNALKFEEGSLSVPGIIALGASVGLLMETGIENINNEVSRLGELIIANVKERGFRLITPEDKHKRGGAVCFSGPFDPANIKEELASRNIAVNVRGGGLRVSPHFYNTDDEIKSLFKCIDDLLS